MKEPILTRLRRKLKEKKGALSVDMSAFFILGMALLITLITYTPAMTKQQTLNTVAHELARYVEVRGKVGSETNTEFARLCEASTLYDASFQIDGAIGPGGIIQLQDEFSVEVVSSAKINVGGVVTLNVPVKGKAAGRSEVYHK